MRQSIKRKRVPGADRIIRQPFDHMFRSPIKKKKTKLKVIVYKQKNLYRHTLVQC
jgi:hypothetical protein